MYLVRSALMGSAWRLRYLIVSRYPIFYCEKKRSVSHRIYENKRLISMSPLDLTKR
jgi:hypothetical protein